jgi:Holliday junction resolvasome RuvABC endonuclease subunit
MGLDLSLAGTGIAWWNGEIAGVKLVRTPASLTTEERIHKIKRAIQEVWEYVLPHLVGIEGYAYSRAAVGKSSSIIQLAELNGVVKNFLWSVEQPFVVKVQSTIKKHATGRGTAEKWELVQAAQDYLPGQLDDNICDAFWLAHMCYEKFDELVEES